ncbi:MAG: MerR family transcriptional regulator [Chloroflexi bacterium]|nr:MerR family transcriptional regulator [Chloroflexota bacterium]
MANDSPLYNLSAVLKETGIKADTLRAWERRYGLPQPRRTAGGHRLYSARDLQTIQWLKMRLSEGLSISSAVGMWQEILGSGRDPLAEYVPPPDPSASSGTEASIHTLRDNWLIACLAFAERQAEDTLNLAFALYPVETVCSAILQQGLNILGQRWYEGKCTVQQEHFASSLVIRRLEILKTVTPPPTQSKSILIGCPAGEHHFLPALFLSLYLRRSGYTVISLGADIPLEQLQETTATISPDLVIMMAQHLPSAATLRSAALLLREQNTPLAYGGLVFNRIPRLRERIPAHFLGEKLERAAQAAACLLTYPPPLAPAMRSEFVQCAGLLKEKRPLVELALSRDLKTHGVSIEYLREANAYFGDWLIAALDLGDLSLLENDIIWLKGLLAGHDASAGQLIPFFSYYSRAIERILGQGGAPIANWLDSYISRQATAQR